MTVPHMAIEASRCSSSRLASRTRMAGSISPRNIRGTKRRFANSIGRLINFALALILALGPPARQASLFGRGRNAHSPSPSRLGSARNPRGFKAANPPKASLCSNSKVVFEPNPGKAAASGRFIARAPGYDLELASTGPVFDLHGPSELAESKSAKNVDEDTTHSGAALSARNLATVPEQRLVRELSSPTPDSRKQVAKRPEVRLHFIGASRHPQITGVDKLPATTNYLIGKDPSNWRPAVPNYEKVKYESLYPGVDLLFYCGGDGLEYDIIVSPGADPSRVRIEVEGATSVKLTDDGQLTAETPSGTIRQIHPVIYQEIDGTRKPLAGGYRLEGHNRVGFVVDRYDPRGLLVIDPSVQFITILGGQPSTSTLGNAITVDSQGNSYITGVTSSPQFQTKKPFQKNLKGTNAFVTKLDPNGAIVYSTFLGGSVVDQGFGIAADSSGSAYILGLTLSPDFPTTAGAFQRVQAGQSDAFVSKLSPDGRSLAYSTLYGGSGSDNATGIALASGQGLPPGAVVITGGTLSADLPVKNAFQSTLGTAIQSGFVAAFDPSGSSLIYATYLGPTGVSNAAGAAIDGEGNAFIVGATISNTFPTTPGAFQTTEGFPGKAFVTKFSPTGSLAASTYFGGNATDSGVAISLTSDGSPVILINTTSTNLQSTLGSSFSGKGDAYTAGLDSNLTTYNFGGYIADSGMTTGLGLGSDTTTGQIAIVGKTDATDLASINAPTGLSLPVSGQTNAFAVVVDPTAATTRFSAAVVDQAVDTIPFSASWSFPNSQFCDAVGAGLRPGSFTVLCTSSSMSPPLARTPLVDIIGLQQPDVADLEIDPIFSDLVVKRTSAGDTVVQAYIKVVNNGPSSAQNVTLSVTPSCGGFVDAQAPALGAQITHPAVGINAPVNLLFVSSLAEGAAALALVRFNVKGCATPIIMGWDIHCASSTLDRNLSNNFAELSINGDPLDSKHFIYWTSSSDGPKDLTSLTDPNSAADSIPLRSAIFARNPHYSAAATQPKRNSVSELSGNLVGYNVYSSSQSPVQPIQANLLATVPPNQTFFDASSAPANSFFIVTAVYTDGESALSNEVGGPPPTIQSISVSDSSIVVKGSGFTAPVQVSFAGVPFDSPPVVKKQGRKIIQGGTLLGSLSISQVVQQSLDPGDTILITIVSSNGNGVAVKYTPK